MSGQGTTEELFGTDRSKKAFRTVACISVSCGSSGLGCTCLNLVINGDTKHTLVSFFGNILFFLLILYCLYSCHPYEIQFLVWGELDKEMFFFLERIVLARNCIY